MVTEKAILRLPFLLSDRIRRAIFNRLLGHFPFFGSRWLMGHNTVTKGIVSFKNRGSGVAAEVTVDAILCDI